MFRDVVAGGDIGASSDLPAAWVVASLTGLLPLPGTQEVTFVKKVLLKSSIFINMVGSYVRP